MRTPPQDLAADLLNQSDLILRSDPPATFQEVAESVGRSRAALYYYFAGRDDLVAFVLQAHVSGGAAAMADADPGTGAAIDRLHAMLGAAIGYLGSRPQVCAGLLAAASAGGSFTELMAANDRHIATPVRARLFEGLRDGTVRVSLPTVATDAVLGALLLAVIGRWSRGEDATDGEFQAAVLDQVIVGVRSTPD